MKEVPAEQGREEQTLEVAIEKMVYGGDGLARTPEGVLLIPGAIPGERATVRTEPVRRGVRRGHLVEVLDASPDRIAPACPYFGRCGGCQHQHISYARQLELKQQILAECFERIGKFRLEAPITVIAAEPWGYRNRIRLQVEKQSSAFQVGYLELSSHQLCAVDCCPISSPALQAVIQELSQGTLASFFPDGTAELELFASDSDRTLWATVYSSQTPPPDFGEKWMSALGGFESVCWRQDPPGKDTVWGSGAITYRVGEFHYRISHHSFFQPNRFLMDQMIQTAVGDSSGTRALDLFAGVGFFTVPLTRRFERVMAVEAHPSAARDLATNVGVAGTRVHGYHKMAEHFLATTSHNWDLVLVDPPRSGLSHAVRERLKHLRPRQLVYVSCDPTTLARDLASLLPSGYQIRSVYLVDQFPQTLHLESVARLELQG